MPILTGMGKQQTAPTSKATFRLGLANDSHGT